MLPDSFDSLKLLFYKLPLTVLIVVPGYSIFCLIISIHMYKRIKKYFPSEERQGYNLFKNIEINNENKESLLNKEDDNYPEFKREDIACLSFKRIFFGTLFFVFFRFIFFFSMILICVILLILSNFILYFFINNPKASSLKRGVIRFIILITIWPFKVFSGFLSEYSILINQKVKDVYFKYFGQDYDLYKKDYSLLISNHHGWMESTHWLIFETPGFVAKKELALFPIIGTLLISIDCLFVDRKNKENRHLIADQIKERQVDFMNKNNKTPILIYPEGTVSSGKYILEFKKGAFQSKLPIKPIYSEVDNEGYGINLCPMPFLEHFYYIFCFIWRKTKFYELPIIECNEYMIKNHSIQGESHEDTYTRISNQIYQEIFGLKNSNKTFRDLDDYEELCNRREIKII